MAVAEILATYDPPLIEERWAWKMFQTREGMLEFPHYSLSGDYCAQQRNRPARRGVWLAAVKARATYLGGWYETGFHVSPDRAGLAVWSVRPNRVAVRVLVRGIRLLATHTPEGIHDSKDRMTIWVADEMLIPEE